ncbi:hypothetical protein [Trueperella sp. LYQ143]|uniref:hypothetical protein n=1 Tax=Trueperella sp. LYQ143 TaxID=3391059 RepID=UPI003983CA8E
MPHKIVLCLFVMGKIAARKLRLRRGLSCFEENLDTVKGVKDRSQPPRSARETDARARRVRARRLGDAGEASATSPMLGSASRASGQRHKKNRGLNPGQRAGDSSGVPVRRSASSRGQSRREEAGSQSRRQAQSGAQSASSPRGAAKSNRSKRARIEPIVMQESAPRRKTRRKNDAAQPHGSSGGRSAAVRRDGNPRPSRTASARTVENGRSGRSTVPHPVRRSGAGRGMPGGGTRHPRRYSAKAAAPARPRFTWWRRFRKVILSAAVAIISLLLVMFYAMHKIDRHTQPISEVAKYEAIVCTPHSLNVSVDRSTTGAGHPVQFAVTLANNGMQPCYFNASHLSLQITSGGQLVYDSVQCSAALADKTLLLDTQLATTQTLTWDGRASGAGCAGTAMAQPGMYVATVALSGESVLSQPDIFELTATGANGVSNGQTAPEAASGQNGNQAGNGQSEGSQPNSQQNEANQPAHAPSTDGQSTPTSPENGQPAGEQSGNGQPATVPPVSDPNAQPSG